MDNLEMIKQMTADFAAKVKEIFPDCTSASIYVGEGGFQQIDAVKFAKVEGDPENAKRRQLLLLSKSDYKPEWEDGSDRQKGYYKSKGCLLEGV